MSRRRRGLRAKSEINVVPYIDVMLVLLVIFMISAPLLNQSVEVNLPQSANSQDIEAQSELGEVRPLIITIDKDGAYYIDRTEDNATPVDQQTIAIMTAEALSANPRTPVYIRADEAVAYGAVMVVMDLLKNSGAEAVGLITTDEE